MKDKLVKKSSGYYKGKTRVLVKGANRTHCKRGHRMTPENTYKRRDGSLRCFACHRAYDRKRGGSSVRALPIKAQARIAAARAFPKREVCEVEGCEDLGVRHHDDYSKPLEIRWLCPFHHGLEHSFNVPDA
jgi:hypothetical protein